MTTTNEGAIPALTEHKIKVLLVDDQPIVAAAVGRMLEPEKDLEFHYCQEAAQALGKAAEIGPTVILQDLVMPDIDGLTLVKFIRAHPALKDVPLIVLSSKEEAVTKADAFAAGANDYLVKLPDRIELIARIRYHSRGYINLLERNEAYRALMSELAQAAEYATSLLPPPLTEGAVQTAWRFYPSTQLGGDCFGYHWVDQDHFAFYLLDVCGHGVGSALLSVSAINVLRSQALPGVDFTAPEKVLGGLNESFQMQNHNNMYFTIWYGVYHRRTHTLSFASGGHPPALLIPDGGDASQLTAANFVIGAFPNVSYCGQKAVIQPPATLYVFSDGVYEVERQDGTMWSLAELEGFLAHPPSAEGSEMDLLYKTLREMRGRETLDDDFSMLKVTLT
jgi:sigma-B regulation protein RsbU (phosphoserine phosphatase)